MLINHCGLSIRWLRLAALSLSYSIFGFAGHAGIYLKIDDIDGESQDADHVGWIELQSFSAGIGSKGSDASGSTRTSSAPSPDSMKVGKLLDAASPYLFLASAQQSVFPSIVLESERSIGKEGDALLRYELTNASVVALETSTVDPSEARSDASIQESVEFSFEAWAMHYQRPGLDRIAATWNFVDGTGGLIGESSPESPQIAPFETLLSKPGEEYTIKVSISDGDTPVEELTLKAESLDPQKVSVIGLEGTGAERSLRILVSEFFSGSASLHVWVSDGFQSRSRPLLLSIEGGETPYESFLLAAFGDALAKDAALGSPIGDPDKDGLKTIAEFYLGTDPNQFTNSEDAIDVQQVLESGEVKTQLRYFRRSDMPGLTGHFLLSSNLKQWTQLGPNTDPALSESTAATDGPYEQVSATLDLSLEKWGNSFLRLQVDGAF
ncbi:type VI secretion system tube protein Hcp [Pelagicoccus sp. NFK12]|uniref:Type VI secretion system tube protein Hcp n=1 Tax=Pelagicoccus enzymogenes TaxID=2773457 RepID=A0A927FBZ3_9BACT|nr:type VI secretion system tube protein Hcp [Pelagicoccus enzymogenes]MBD5782312.1 type VI secretion system tube protein Hcp [Pelagicoccus enzymogenes]